jgi:NAD(P)-dependent dehydrogenase (short-subunit alcohol dehydrogenase family)
MKERRAGDVKVPVEGPGNLLDRAAAFGLEGARWALIDCDPATGEATAENFRAVGVETVFLAGDVSQARDVRRVVDAMVDRFGRIEIPCQNAGVFPQTLIAGPLSTTSPRTSGIMCSPSI